MKTKFTPGPWMFIIDKLKNEHPIMSLNENKNIACVNSSSHLGNCLPDESQSNAKLIAAAPDLLKALETLVKVSRDGYVRTFEDTQAGFINWEKEVSDAILKGEKAIKKAIE